MTFVDFVAVLRRHMLLVVYGLLVAVLLATFSTYRLQGTSLVSRSVPVYQSNAVVAVRPGAEHVTTTVAAPPTSAVPTAIVDAGDPAATALPTTTTIAVPPLAPLSAVIDSRAMYYTALSLKTIVVSPGFAEAVQARAPAMDGSISAVVAQDTNTMNVVVDGSTPATTAATMSAALAELQSVIAAYSSTPATRFGLDGVVIGAPSTPAAKQSIKGPLTFAVVLVIVLVLWWLLIRAVDALGRAKRAKRATAERRAAATRASSTKSDDRGGLEPPQPVGAATPSAPVGAETPSPSGNGRPRRPAAPTR